MRMSCAERGASILPLVLILGWHLDGEMRLEAQPSKGTNSPPATTSGPPPQMRVATRNYRQYCARCHSEDYQGTAWRERGRQIPDFTSGAWQNSRTDAQLLVSVLEGKGALMPAFNEKLSKDQVRSLVLLLRKAGATRSIAAEVAPTGAPTDFARRYAELLAELEELRKHYRALENAQPRRGPQAHDSVSPSRRPAPR